MHREVILQKFREFLRYMSPRTINSYCGDVRHFFRFYSKELSLLSKRDLEEWLNHIHSLSALKIYPYRKLMSIRKFCDFLLKEGVIQENFAFQINGVQNKKPPPAQGSLSAAQAMLFIQDQDPTSQRDAAMIAVVLGTGARVSQLCSLLRSHVTKIPGGAAVQLQNRCVILRGSLAKVLLDHAENVKEGFLFSAKGKKAISRQCIWTSIQNRAKQHGFPRITLRQVRVDFILQLAKENPRSLSDLIELCPETQGRYRQFARKLRRIPSELPAQGPIVSAAQA